MKQPERARVRKVRIFGAQNRNFSLDPRIFGKIDCGSSRRVYSRRVARVRQKRNVAGSRIVKPCSACDLNLGKILINPSSR
jgi:hypothetical protein